jgi:hypothetical protein
MMNSAIMTALRYKHLVASLVIVLLIGTSAVAQEIYKEAEGLYSTREIASAKIPTTAGNHVSIESASTLEGTIHVVTDDGTTVRATYHKKARTDSRSKAIDYIDLIGLSFSKSPQGARIQMRAPNPAPWQERSEGGMVDIEVTVPEGSYLEIDARLFNLDVEGPVSGVVVPSSLGRVDIVDVNGVVDISTANQKVSLEDVVGEISVVTSNARIDGINLESRNVPASFRNDGGDIMIEDYTGEISVRNNFGRISLIGLNIKGTKNYIRGLSEPILLEIVDMDDARLTVNNQYEDIELVVPRSISALISLAVEDGNTIEATNMLVKPDLVESNRLYLISGEGTSTLTGSIQGRGNIYIQGRE